MKAKLALLGFFFFVSQALADAKISAIKVTLDGERVLASFSLQDAFDHRLSERVDSGLVAEHGHNTLHVHDAGVRPGTAYDYQVANLEGEAWQVVREVRVATPAAALSLRLTGANPSIGAVRLAYSIPRPGPVSLQIFAPDGRRVRGLLSEVRPAGGQEATWDGRDEAGRSMPAGIYVARLRAGAGVTRLKIVRID